ncbi:MAG: sugar phosphate nucleotidyltransferase, partial [Planctomycetota bacterium]|nr:sugar phosphate nucleotidyltransferase [Planctomycetota bacterium]
HQFEEWARDFESPCPVRLIDDGSTSDDDKRGGVADMALAWDEASRDAETEVLVLAGDNLLEFQMRLYAETFRRLARPMMLVRHFPEGAPPGRFGEVVADQTGRITRFREKPAKPESPYAATCIYFFPPSVRARLREYLAAGGEPDAPGHFMAWLSEREEVHAVPFVGTAHDVGNLETLKAARAAYEGRD